MASSLPKTLPDLSREVVNCAREMHERARTCRPSTVISTVGHPCSLKLWYGFQDTTGAKPDAARLRSADGRSSEDNDRKLAAHARHHQIHELRRIINVRSM